jgi:hypothetical protein
MQSGKKHELQSDYPKEILITLLKKCELMNQ